MYRRKLARGKRPSVDRAEMRPFYDDVSVSLKFNFLLRRKEKKDPETGVMPILILPKKRERAG